MRVNKRMSDLRVLMVNSMKPTANNPGAGIFISRQIASLTMQGAEVKNFYLDDRTSIGGLLRNLRRLRHDIILWRPDVVHAQYGSATSLVTVLAAAGKPVVVSFCGSDLYGTSTTSKLRSNVGVLLSKISALLADAVICKSSELASKLWATSKVEVIPNGVDIHLFRPVARDEARSYLSWGPEEKVVLFNVGNNPLTKRLDLAESAAALAAQRLAGLRLEVMSGCPPEQVPWLMNASDCLLITSDHEGSPNILKEALSCNLPVVSVDCGDARERLDGVYPSCIVERDPVRIADGLLSVLALQRRSNGREKAEMLSQERIAQKILSLYRSLVNR